MGRLLIKNARALVGTWPADQVDVKGLHMADIPLLEDAWLMAEDGIISSIGKMDEFPGIEDWNELELLDAENRFVLPGWCDPHTHTVFAAPREREFVDRLNGLSYQEIASRGGGILNSADCLRGMSQDDLYLLAKGRLQEMMQQGTVAVEIKSGYGLSLESELKMLRVIAMLRESLPLQIKATILGAHAIPMEFKDDRDGYMDMVCDALIPAAAAEGLADFVDIFCEEGYFTIDEMNRVIETGKTHDLKAKVHVNQFTSMGAIKAAVDHDALSVDHLEELSDADLDALLGSDTYPTLLPSCSFFLGIPYGPAKRLVQANLPLALATDFNPGSTPSGNMNFVLSLACIRMGLLPEEAITAATMNAAAAMEVSNELGSITIGKRASFIITKQIPSLAYYPYAFGQNHIDSVVIDGRIIRRGEA
jgi:imidazolonepropionase